MNHDRNDADARSSGRTGSSHVSSAHAAQGQGVKDKKKKPSSNNKSLGKPQAQPSAVSTSASQRDTGSGDGDSYGPPDRSTLSPRAPTALPVDGLHHGAGGFSGQDDDTTAVDADLPLLPNTSSVADAAAVGPIPSQSEGGRGSISTTSRNCIIPIAPGVLGTSVCFATSEDESYPASELNQGLNHGVSPSPRGWQSAKLGDMPQELGIVFTDDAGEVVAESVVQQIQILAHQSKTPTRVDIYVFPPPSAESLAASAAAISAATAEAMRMQQQQNEIDQSAFDALSFGSVASTLLALPSWSPAVASNGDIQASVAVAGQNPHSRPALSSSSSYPPYESAPFHRLGYVTFRSNEATQFRSRERKSVQLNVRAVYLKLVLHKCHSNAVNLYSQVGIVALTAYGTTLQQTADAVAIHQRRDGSTTDERQQQLRDPQTQQHLTAAISAAGKNRFAQQVQPHRQPLAANEIDPHRGKDSPREHQAEPQVATPRGLPSALVSLAPLGLAAASNPAPTPAAPVTAPGNTSAPAATSVLLLKKQQQRKQEQQGQQSKAAGKAGAATGNLATPPLHKLPPASSHTEDQQGIVYGDGGGGGGQKGPLPSLVHVPPRLKQQQQQGPGAKGSGGGGVPPRPQPPTPGRGSGGAPPSGSTAPLAALVGAHSGRPVAAPGTAASAAGPSLASSSLTRFMTFAETHLAAMRRTKDAAVAAERYDRAERIKRHAEWLQLRLVDAQALDRRKVACVGAEDYLAAYEIHRQQEEVLNDIERVVQTFVAEGDRTDGKGKEKKKGGNGRRRMSSGSAVGGGAAATDSSATTTPPISGRGRRQRSNVSGATSTTNGTSDDGTGTDASFADATPTPADSAAGGSSAPSANRTPRGDYHAAPYAPPPPPPFHQQPPQRRHSTGSNAAAAGFGRPVIHANSPVHMTATQSPPPPPIGSPLQLQPPPPAPTFEDQPIRSKFAQEMSRLAEEQMQQLEQRQQQAHLGFHTRSASGEAVGIVAHHSSLPPIQVGGGNVSELRSNSVAGATSPTTNAALISGLNPFGSALDAASAAAITAASPPPPLEGSILPPTGGWEGEVAKWVETAAAARIADAAGGLPGADAAATDSATMGGSGLVVVADGALVGAAGPTAGALQYAVGHYATSCLCSRRWIVREAALTALTQNFAAAVKGANRDATEVAEAVLQYIDTKGFGLTDPVPSVQAAAREFLARAVAAGGEGGKVSSSAAASNGLEGTTAAVLQGRIHAVVPRLLHRAGDANGRTRDDIVTLMLAIAQAPGLGGPERILSAITARPVDADKKQMAIVPNRVWQVRLTLAAALAQGDGGANVSAAALESLAARLLVPCINHPATEVREQAVALMNAVLDVFAEPEAAAAAPSDASVPPHAGPGVPSGTDAHSTPSSSPPTSLDPRNATRARLAAALRHIESKPLQAQLLKRLSPPQAAAAGAAGVTPTRDRQRSVSAIPATGVTAAPPPTGADRGASEDRASNSSSPSPPKFNGTSAPNRGGGDVTNVHGSTPAKAAAPAFTSAGDEGHGPDAARRHQQTDGTKGGTSTNGAGPAPVGAHAATSPQQQSPSTRTPLVAGGAVSAGNGAATGRPAGTRPPNGKAPVVQAPHRGSLPQAAAPPVTSRTSPAAGRQAAIAGRGNLGPPLPSAAVKRRDSVPTAAAAAARNARILHRDANSAAAVTAAAPVLEPAAALVASPPPPAPKGAPDATVPRVGAALPPRRATPPPLPVENLAPSAAPPATGGGSFRRNSAIPLADAKHVAGPMAPSASDGDNGASKAAAVGAVVAQQRQARSRQVSPRSAPTLPLAGAAGGRRDSAARGQAGPPSTSEETSRSVSGRKRMAAGSAADSSGTAAPPAAAASSGHTKQKKKAAVKDAVPFTTGDATTSPADPSN